MKAILLVISDLAAADIVEQADWCEAQSGEALAELRGLRRSAITGFPKHLIFYRFTENEVFVMRVIHGTRALERLL